jgi:hypothetical protein
MSPRARTSKKGTTGAAKPAKPATAAKPAVAANGTGPGIRVRVPIDQLSANLASQKVQMELQKHMTVNEMEALRITDVWITCVLSGPAQVVNRAMQIGGVIKA